MAHSVNDVVFKLFLIVTDRQTDRPTTPSVKEMTTPSAKKNSFTLKCRRPIYFDENFPSKYIDSDAVLVFSVFTH